MRLLIFFVLLIFGLLATMYAFQFVRTFGHITWAERHLGPGGSYTLWRLIGVVCVLGSFLFLRFGESWGLI